MTNDPALTVLIPTCDRPDTLHHCLKTVVSQDHPGLEILVSDNASEASTREVIERFDDPRLRSLRMPERLGMAEHWEVALGEARGEWITVLGDDDGLLPGAVARFLEVASNGSVDAYTSLRCGYLWPGAYERVGACLTARRGRGPEVRDSKEWLTAVVQGERGYGGLPYIYTGGFVRRRIMETIRDRTGRFFSSMIPDVYSGFAVASVIPQYGFLSEPLAIEGTSPASNGRKVFKPGAEKAGLPELFKEGVLRFHPQLGNGNVPSIPLMVYESYLQSEELRDYRVDTDLGRQLESAMSAPKRVHARRVAEYCREVAEANGLDFEGISRRARRAAFRNNLRKKLSGMFHLARRSSGIRESRVRDAAIDDVFKASVRLGEMLDETAG